VRLVSFTLVVYKRGYAGYRSDALLEGGPRSDFTARHNRIELRKWRERDSHAEHLLFLAPPRAIARETGWEQHLANLDLYRALGGRVAAPERPTKVIGGEEPVGETPQTGPTLLDATELLDPESVRVRTQYEGELEILQLGGFERTSFYHGVHLRAKDGGEEEDVAYHVWKSVPGGLETVRDTIRASLPKVKPTSEVTKETYVFESDRVRAIGFIDEEQDVGVLLTCGAAQCPDLDTALILAKFLHGRLDLLEQVPASSVRTSEPGKPEPEPEPEPDAPEATEPEGDEPEKPATEEAEPEPETEPKVPSEATKEENQR
jgi:hypothetical protein